MRFKIPFAGSNIDRLKKISKPYFRKVRHKPDSKMSMYLKNSGAPVSREQYIGISRIGHGGRYLGRLGSQ